MMVDDLGGAGRTPQWIDSEIKHQVAHLFTNMIQRVDRWTDAFEIKRYSTDGKEVWVEKIEHDRRQFDFVFSKTHLRRWTFWDDLTVTLGLRRLERNEPVDVDGQAYKVIARTVVRAPQEDELLAKFKSMKDDWRYAAMDKAAESSKYERQQLLTDYTCLYAPNNFN